MQVPPARRFTALIAEDEPMLRAQLRARLAHAWPELAVTADRMAKVVERLQQRLASPPLDLASVLTRLAARDGTSPLRWIRASLGASMRLIPVDEICYFHAENKYTKVVTATGEALIRKT